MEAYKERFVHEYTELADRLEKLELMLKKYDAGTLDFEPSCPVRLLREQARVMTDYKLILEERAVIEKIPLK